MPRVYMIAYSTPNAFATGRNPQHAAVAVTEGTLRLLDQRELEGVLAHELAHIKNRDTLTMTVTATIASAIMFLANMARWGAMFGGVSRDEEDRGGGLLGLLVAAIVAPLAATLVQMAISRSGSMRPMPRRPHGRESHTAWPMRWRNSPMASNVSPHRWLASHRPFLYCQSITRTTVCNAL